MNIQVLKIFKSWNEVYLIMYGPTTIDSRMYMYVFVYESQNDCVNYNQWKLYRALGMHNKHVSVDILGKHRGSVIGYTIL